MITYKILQITDLTFNETKTAIQSCELDELIDFICGDQNIYTFKEDLIKTLDDLGAENDTYIIGQFEDKEFVTAIANLDYVKGTSPMTMLPCGMSESVLCQQYYN